MPKNRGSKIFYPPQTRFLDDSRGVSGKNFLNPKFLANLIFIAFLGNSFSKICQNFLKRCLRCQFRARRASQPSPMRKFWASRPPPEISDGNLEGSRKIIREPLIEIYLLPSWKRFLGNESEMVKYYP